MRKLTYKQAATCGENLKARVTPEQSEKMQLAWFAAGKRWIDGTQQIISETAETFIYLGDGDNLCNLTRSIDFQFFKQHNYEEIELIDDLPQHDFTSQQEVWAWLSEKNKQNRVISKDGSKIAGFSICGNLFDYKNRVFFAISGDAFDFSDPLNWKKHTPPRLIRVNGIEVPAPLESFNGLANDANVWAVYLPKCSREDSVCHVSIRCGLAESALRQGLCYATKEDAIKRAEAMVKFEVVE